MQKPTSERDVHGDDADAPKADPTMTKPRGKPSGENVPPAGGESMAPAESRHPHAPPGGRATDPKPGADDR